jgi:hypothetical protein
MTVSINGEKNFQCSSKTKNLELSPQSALLASNAVHNCTNEENVTLGKDSSGSYASYEMRTQEICHKPNVSKLLLNLLL